MDKKECRRCFEIKPTSEFHKSTRLSDGLQTWCKPCINAYKVEHRARNRTPEQETEYQRQKNNKKLALIGLKICTECAETKPLSEFWKGSSGVITDTRGRCADCQQAWLTERNYSRVETRPFQQRKAVKSVYDAIQKGVLLRPEECQVCHQSPLYRNRERIEFHHTDGYSEENTFVGIFVCSRCHRAIHLGKINVTGKQHIAK